MEWSKETCGTWLLVSAGYCNPAAKLHPQIGYRRFTPARGLSKNFLDIYVHFCYNYHVGH